MNETISLLLDLFIYSPIYATLCYLDVLLVSISIQLTKRLVAFIIEKVKKHEPG